MGLSNPSYFITTKNKKNMENPIIVPFDLNTARKIKSGEILRSSNIEGRYIQVNQEPCNTHVDWEQRRYEMAKTMLPITSVSGRGPHGELILEACDKAAELAVIYADALIKGLK